MFKDLFLRPLFKNIKRNKNFVIIMMISLTSILFIVNVVFSLNAEIVNLKNNIDNRKFQIQKLSKDFDIKNISSNKKIVDYYIEYKNLVLKTNDISFEALYSNIDEYKEKILKGKTIDINEKNVVVLPDKILMNDKSYDLKDCLGKNIEFNLYDGEVYLLKYSAKVVGIYKSNKLNSTIYIPKIDYIKFLGQDKKYEKMNIVVNNYNDLYVVSNNFLKSYNVYFDGTINTELLTKKLSLYNFLFFSICLILIILLIVFNVTLKNIEFDLKKDIILLRIVGFSALSISFSVFKILVIMFLIAYFLSIILNIIFFLLFFNNFELIFLERCLIIFLACLVIICLSCIEFYNSLKKKKIFLNEL